MVFMEAIMNYKNVQEKQNKEFQIHSELKKISMEKMPYEQNNLIRKEINEHYKKYIF